MRINDLERFLEQGNYLGFNKETNDLDFKGWITLRKEKTNQRYLSQLAYGEDLLFISKQKEIQEKPYIVRVFELRCDVYKAQVYEDESDYKINEHFRFADLTEVGEFLKEYGKNLSEIKWLTEINAP